MSDDDYDDDVGDDDDDDDDDNDGGDGLGEGAMMIVTVVVVLVAAAMAPRRTFRRKKPFPRIVCKTHECTKIHQSVPSEFDRHCFNVITLELCKKQSSVFVINLN